MTRWIRIILSMVLMAALVCGTVGCIAEETQALKKGSIITFGRYPQTAEGTDETPIEWIVLKVNESNHWALLISKYGLDAKPYNTKDIDITWEMCSLRRWLNQDFLSKAFSPEEQAAIRLTNVLNSDTQGYREFTTSGGNKTQDYIFLLSYAEAKRYFNVEYYGIYEKKPNTASRVAPTAYAIKQGALSKSDFLTEEGNAAGLWWLRSPSGFQHFASMVEYEGTLDGYYVDIDIVCVRPAMWVDLSLIPSAP